MEGKRNPGERRETDSSSSRAASRETHIFYCRRTSEDSGEIAGVIFFLWSDIRKNIPLVDIWVNLQISRWHRIKTFLYLFAACWEIYQLTPLNGWHRVELWLGIICDRSEVFYKAWRHLKTCPHSGGKVPSSLGKVYNFKGSHLVKERVWILILLLLLLRQLWFYFISFFLVIFWALSQGFLFLHC